MSCIGNVEMRNQVVFIFNGDDDDDPDLDDDELNHDDDDGNGVDNDNEQAPYDWATEGSKPIPASLYKANMSTR